MTTATEQTRLTMRVALAMLLVVPVLFYVLFIGARGWLADDAHQISGRTLSLYVSGLEELLSKYEPLPGIYALHPSVQTVLKTPDWQDAVTRANHLLETWNTATGAADTYVLDATGMTIAASNYNQPVTFLGRSFSFRPYFQDAMKTGPGASGKGRFFALGTTSLQRGYYLSHAVVNDEGERLGVVVVKVDIAAVEESWRASDLEVLVTDALGVTFLSSNEDWLYDSLGQLAPAALETLGETRRYAGEKIGRLPFDVRPEQGPWPHVFQPTTSTASRYFAAFKDLPEADWRVWILHPSTPVTSEALAYAGAGVLILVLAAITGVSLVERRRGLMRALAVQQRARRTLENAASELERQVERRTRDLKRTQNELVQAGKMAALGQMSVGINHELNQPLTAIRSYAENAEKLMAHGRTDEARENMGLIAALSERMGDIILRLKIFARASSDERADVSLRATVDNVMRIVAPRMKKERVEMVSNLPDDDVWVRANDVRLEQVLVNLINNAVDAMVETQDRPGARRITLAVDPGPDVISVSVTDTGPGIPDAVMDQLFEPFVTTKDVGLGLGLGLSISYGIIQDLGGELTARNLETGGAAFTFTLPCASDTVPDTEAGSGPARPSAQET